MTRKTAEQLSYDASTVWGAACTAQRINGSYVNSIQVDILVDAVNSQAETSAPTVNQDVLKAVKDILTNRDILKAALKDQTMVTDADRAAGEEVRCYYKGFTFKILQGKKLSNFDNTAMVIANRDMITSMYDVAVIASLPSSFERGRVQDQNNYRIQAASGFIGQLGDKIKIEIEVVKSIFSTKYGTNFITGITSTNESVFFAIRKGMTVGDKVKIKGTVKAHRDTSTQLNRVKVV